MVPETDEGSQHPVLGRERSELIDNLLFGYGLGKVEAGVEDGLGHRLGDQFIQ